MKAQAAVAEYPDFKGNVAFVSTRAFWRPEDQSPSKQGYHWNSNAETYYLIGEAMGEGGMGGGWREAGAQVRGFDTDHHFAPCVARGAVKLADRQGIEEFIGKQKERRVGQLGYGIGPFGMRHALGLGGAQSGGGFDEDHV